MAGTSRSGTNVGDMLLPIRHIGVVYCTSPLSAAGREFEKLADCEIVDVAYAVRDALQIEGYGAELVDVEPERIRDLQRFDWVFNLTESIYGYPLADFEIARVMEKYRIGFTGAGSKVLQTCTDKAATKYLLLSKGINTPAFQVFQPGKPIHNGLKFPLFVKPVSEDASIGINDDSIVRNENELKRQVRSIHRMYKQAALVEQYIEGREITASVIGNGEQAVALPLSEIIYGRDISARFLTFDAKWVTGSIEYQESVGRCPTDLPPDTDHAIKDIALRAYHALGCRDYARVDFRLSGDCPFVLEVNPNPCINPDNTGFVRAATAAGYSYNKMVARILSAAVQDRARFVKQEIIKVPYYISWYN